MRPTHLLLLAGATAAAVVAAYSVLDQRPAPGPDAGLPRLLFPDLASKINTVVQVTVATHEHTATILRPVAESGRWTVKEKAGYPASPDMIKKTVVGLTDLRAIEVRTADRALYDRLGVEDIDQAGTAVRVGISDAAGTQLAAVLRGKIAARGGLERPDSFYVRVPGEAQSWLAEGHLDPIADPIRWVDRELPKLTSVLVMAVTVERPGVGKVAIAKTTPADSDYTLAEVPSGSKPKTVEINRLGGALEFLTFDDVVRLDPSWFGDAATTVFRSFDGVVVTVRSARHDGKVWLSFQVAFDGEQAGKLKRESEDTRSLLSAEEAEKLARVWQERYSSWAYQVSDYAADGLAPKPETLVAKEGS